MGVVGGTLGYRLLKLINSSGETPYMDGSAYSHKSKLEVLLGPNIWREIEDKVVIDFGCGEGAEAIEMARHGARKVVGIDNRQTVLATARERAARAGVADRCLFASHVEERADVVVTVDTFEHFGDPLSALEAMRGMLGEAGSVLVAFGPIWYHPLGGHLFSVFPWAHLIFTEKALIRWRSEFRADGATRFCEVEGGLNRMTIHRFERLVRQSPFSLAEFEAVPIRKLRWVANRFTREVTTAGVRCRLIPRS